MDILRIDLETYSGFDLKKVGVYRYAEHPDFQVMLFGFQWNDGPRQVIDLTVEPLPFDLDEALTDPLVQKVAFNANFERTCLRRMTGRDMPPEQWRCTMVHALYLGLPGSLEQVGQVLKADVKKSPEGKALIRYFCMPCKPTKKNGQRKRNLPTHDPEKWERFKWYCGEDVGAEESIAKRLGKSPVPPIEWRYWCMSQRMSDKGVLVDRDLLKHAIAADEVSKQTLLEEAVELTGLDNPNSVEQLKKWLTEEIDDTYVHQFVQSLTKKSIPRIIDLVDDAKVQRVLELRLELGRASVKKYHAIDRAVCNDGRIRGTQQFYGANRTGRDAGRIVQLQNMMTNKLSDLALCRQLLKAGEYELLELFFGSISFCLAQLIRTVLIAEQGHVLAPVDFSAVEARALAWVSGEEWRLEVFKTHGQIYEASASQMFNVPWSEFQDYIDRKKKHPLRQKGKVAELALGYWGGANALITMGALEQGLEIGELQPIVDAWRASNPKIKAFVYAMGKAAVRTVKTGLTSNPSDIDLEWLGWAKNPVPDYGIRFRMEKGLLAMRLPSGRELFYVKPRIEYEEGFGEGVTYEGVDQKTRQWVRLRGYAGKWVENFCQAHCRDVLYYKLAEMDDEGLYQHVLFHVHDEAVPEIPIDSDILQRVEDIFGRPIPWAPGMPLRGDGFETPFYMKED